MLYTLEAPLIKMMSKQINALRRGCRLLGFIFSFHNTFSQCNMYVEGLLSANLCSVTLLNSEQCSQF